WWGTAPCRESWQWPLRNWWLRFPPGLPGPRSSSLQTRKWAWVKYSGWHQQTYGRPQAGPDARPRGTARILCDVQRSGEGEGASGTGPRRVELGIFLHIQS